MQESQEEASERMTSASIAIAISIGAIAGISSGLLGVGGGIVMVPLLTILLRTTQHRAHATSLAAIVPIASSGTARFAIAGSINYGLAALLAAGALIGAPLGARLMARSGEAVLKILFGFLMIAVSVELLWP